MFSIFGTNKKENSNSNDGGAPIDSSSVFGRFQIFLKKLDERAFDIAREVEESAQLIVDADTDPHKRSFLQFKGAIIAQFTQIIQKASSTYQTNVIPAARQMEMIEIAPFYADWNAKMVEKMNNLFHGVL